LKTAWALHFELTPRTDASPLCDAPCRSAERIIEQWLQNAPQQNGPCRFDRRAALQHTAGALIDDLF
jgi:hypothetical protein